MKEKIYSHNDPDYINYMKSPEWLQGKRIDALTKHGYTCFACKLIKKPQNIDIHHLTYKNFKNEDLEDLIPLCRPCHQDVHKRHQIYKKQNLNMSIKDVTLIVIAEKNKKFVDGYSITELPPQHGLGFSEIKQKEKYLSYTPSHNHNFTLKEIRSFFNKKKMTKSAFNVTKKLLNNYSEKTQSSSLGYLTTRYKYIEVNTYWDWDVQEPATLSKKAIEEMTKMKNLNNRKLR